MSTLIPKGHFVLGSDTAHESDLRKIPQEINAEISIASADINLRRELEGQGFYTFLMTPNIFHMRRFSLNGLLDRSA